MAITSMQLRFGIIKSDLHVPVNDCLDEGMNFQNMVKSVFFKAKTHVGAK